jgi:rod shape determining protein RodA
MQRFSSFRDFDWTLLSLLGILSIVSVFEIKSATAMTKFHGFDHKQIGFLAVGLVLMFLISVVDYHRLIDIAPWAWGISLVSLVAVKLVGTKVLGARRWINIPHTGIHFQPSEWVKLVLILAVARFFWSRAGRELVWLDIAKAFALVGVPMLLVLTQPDLGTALTYIPILLAGLFLGGISLRQTAILLLGLVLLGAGVFLSGKRLKPYQQARIDAFLDPATRSASPRSRSARAASSARARTTARRPRATSCPFRTPTSSSPRSARSTASSARSRCCCCIFSSSCG